MGYWLKTARAGPARTPPPRKPASRPPPRTVDQFRTGTRQASRSSRISAQAVASRTRASTTQKSPTDVSSESP